MNIVFVSTTALICKKTVKLWSENEGGQIIQTKMMSAIQIN